MAPFYGASCFAQPLVLQAGLRESLAPCVLPPRGPLTLDCAGPRAAATPQLLQQAALPPHAETVRTAGADAAATVRRRWRGDKNTIRKR